MAGSGLLGASLILCLDPPQGSFQVGDPPRRAAPQLCDPRVVNEPAGDGPALRPGRTRATAQVASRDSGPCRSYFTRDRMPRGSASLRLLVTATLSKLHEIQDQLPGWYHLDGEVGRGTARNQPLEVMPRDSQTDRRPGRRSCRALPVAGSSIARRHPASTCRSRARVPAAGLKNGHNPNRLRTGLGQKAITSRAHLDVCRRSTRKRGQHDHVIRVVMPRHGSGPDWTILPSPPFA